MKRFFTHFKISACSLVVALVLFTGQKSWGQVAAWNFFGQSSPTTFAATTFDANLVTTSNASNVTRGSGAASSTGTNSFRTTGFQNNGIATSNTDYFQVTLTAKTGYSVSLSTIDAKFAGTTTFAASPGVTSQFAYSLNGSTFTLISSSQVTIASPATLTQISLSGISALQNVAAGTTITLRYYASGQTTTGGWGFNSPTSTDNGLAIGGSVFCTSPPTASVLANGTGASTICTGSSANLKTTITGGTSPYTLVTSAGTTNSYVSGADVSVSPTMTTPYTLTSVTDANGCASTGLSGTPTVTVTNTWNAVASTGFTTGSTWSCGVAPTSTADVTISGQNVTLSADATLNSITFASGGKLTLGANTLTVGTATGGTSEGWAITNGVGALKIINFTGAKTFPIGTLPAVYAPVIVNNSASARDFSARVGTTISGTPANVSKMVQLEWEVTPSNAVGNNAALTLQWPSSVENGSFVRGNAIEIAHYNGSAWDDFKLATLGGSDPYTATASGFTTFSPFVVANGTALSVDFLDVNVKKQGNGNVLTWKTASEKNNAYFDVQHSTTGRDFDNIGQVKGKGTSTVTNAYIFNHADPSVNTHYYRLRQVAVDGKETFSKVVSIVQSTSGKLNVYPTLANDKLTVSLDNPDVQLYSIFDLSGKAVQSGQIQGQKDLIINTLSVGTYILKVGSETVKFTKN